MQRNGANVMSTISSIRWYATAKESQQQARWVHKSEYEDNDFPGICFELTQE